MTCTKCETRSSHKFTTHSYEKGVVLIRCPGCRNLHLIADNLGWFDDARVNIVDIMKEKGMDVLQLTDNAFEISPELAGHFPAKKATHS